MSFFSKLFAQVKALFGHTENPTPVVPTTVPTVPVAPVFTGIVLPVVPTVSVPTVIVPTNVIAPPAPTTTPSEVEPGIYLYADGRYSVIGRLDNTDANKYPDLAAAHRVLNRDKALAGWTHGDPQPLSAEYLASVERADVNSAYKSGNLGELYRIFAFTPWGQTHQLEIKADLFGVDNDTYARAIRDGETDYIAQHAASNGSQG